MSGTESGYFGMSDTTKYDVESAVTPGVKSGAAIQKHAIQSSMPSSVGFSYSEQGLQNRARKGYWAAQWDRNQKSFYHRCTLMISWLVAAILIGGLLLTVLLLFRGLISYPLTEGISSKASTWGPPGAAIVQTESDTKCRPRNAELTDACHCQTCKKSVEQRTVGLKQWSVHFLPYSLSIYSKAVLDITGGFGGRRDWSKPRIFKLVLFIQLRTAQPSYYDALHEPRKSRGSRPCRKSRGSRPCSF